MYDILSQMLIVSVWEGTRRGGQLWGGREGKRNFRISSLCLWPLSDFTVKPSLRRRSTPGSTFHLSSRRERSEDPGLQPYTLQYRPAFHCVFRTERRSTFHKPQNSIMHFQYKVKATTMFLQPQAQTHSIWGVQICAAKTMTLISGGGDVQLFENYCNVSFHFVLQKQKMELYKHTQLLNSL